jgi:succinyl-diaminopimelate desuccinylase
MTGLSEKRVGETPEIDLLIDLVRRRSITPDDAGCQQMLAERLENAGFSCESLPFAEVSNLWARRGDTGPVLCFAGHTDVVPAGNHEQWDSDPFEPDVRDGKLFGRGAADMKSGLAAMVVAAERFVALHADFDGSIAFLITSDEEGRARNGTLKVIEALQARGEHIDWCVLGEPSSQKTLGDIVRIGRRGSLSGILTVFGVQGHVAYPQLADNPIARFAPVLAELQAIQWDAGNEFFPPTSFQFVELQSGIGAPNVTPAELKARFNFRYSTVWQHAQLKEKTASLLDSHSLNYELDWHLSGKPFLTQRGVLIDATVAAVKQVTGADPELSTGGGTSDGRFISPAGADVVELGPVNASIHKVNECVLLEDVTTLTRIYQQIIERLLGSKR